MTRTLLSVAVVLFVLLGVAGMAWGWRNKGRRQADLPGLPAVPAGLGEPLVDDVEGVYVATTSAGDWLDRIVVHGLGVRSNARVTVAPPGVLLAREGAPDVFVPAELLTGVQLAKGMAGTVVEDDGLVVLTWRHGDRQLATGFRPRYAADRDVVVAAAGQLLGQEAS
ncbi:MAG TPA: hypothetical protein VIM19_03810 [Actinomycetes bacterium]